MSTAWISGLLLKILVPIYLWLIKMGKKADR